MGGRINGGLLAGGSGLVVAAAWTHTSSQPAWLGRYSTSYLALLAGVTLVWSLGCLLLWRRRNTVGPWLARVAERRSGLAPFLVATLTIAVVASLFYARLVAWYFAWWPLVPLGLVLFTAGFALVTRPPPGRARTRAAAGTLAMALVWLLTLVAAEFGLRALDASTVYQVWDTDFHFDVDLLEPAPGVTGPSRFSTGQHGIRGDALPSDDRPRVLAIGGSTTACTLLDDSEAWPRLAQERFNAAHPEHPIWVGSVGRPGHSIIENSYALDLFAPLHEVDVVLLLVGINDLLPTLRGALPGGDDALIRLNHAFQVRPLVDSRLGRGFPEGTALFGVAERFWWRGHYLSQPSTFAASANRPHETRAPARGELRILPELPDLGLALARYRRRVSLAVDIAARHGIRLVFLTQPVLWREGLSAEGQERVSMAYPPQPDGTSVGYELRDLHEGMERFNDVLREVAAERSAQTPGVINVIDLAPAVGGRQAYLYDDCHYTEAGAAKIADMVAEGLGTLLAR